MWSPVFLSAFDGQLMGPASSHSILEWDKGHICHFNGTSFALIYFTSLGKLSLGNFLSCTKLRHEYGKDSSISDMLPCIPDRDTKAGSNVCPQHCV